MEREEAETAENDQTLDEMRIIRVTGAGCITGNPRAIVQTDITPIPPAAVAEGARYRFYDHKFLQAVACNFQFEYSYVNDVNRWGRSNMLQQYITDLKVISEGTADGMVFSAKYGDLADVIVIKTPFNDTYNLSTFHEFFIGALFTNQLRQWIPHFVFILGVFRCSRPVRDPTNPMNVTTYCTERRSTKLTVALPPDELELLQQSERQVDEYLDVGNYAEAKSLMKLIESRYSVEAMDKSEDNPINYLVLENIRGGMSLFQYIQKRNPSIPNLLGCLIQLSTALEMALKRFDFCHYDLHSSNILLRFINDDEILIRTGNRRTFVPIGYGKEDGSRYFIETDYIPTIIDFGRSHVRHVHPITKELSHYGYFYGQHFGVYPDRSRPAYDLYKLVGFLVLDLLTAYDPDVTRGLRQLRASPDEAGENAAMAIARGIYRHVPVARIDFIIRLLKFFPFFKKRYGYATVIDGALRLRVIFWVYAEYAAQKFNLDVKWPEADSDELKGDVHETFYSYLRETFPAEVEQVLWTRETLPENPFVFSCEFNQCSQ